MPGIGPWMYEIDIDISEIWEIKATFVQYSTVSISTNPTMILATFNTYHTADEGSKIVPKCSKFQKLLNPVTKFEIRMKNAFK